MAPSNQEETLLPFRPGAPPAEKGKINTSRSVSCGELKKAPTDPKHKPEWANYASLQDFLDYRRDDLYMAVGPKHPFSRRVAPRTIGKLLDPPPHQEQPMALPKNAVKMKKHSVSQHNIADGDDNEAKHAMTKRQLAHMAHHLRNTDGTNAQCTRDASRKLQKMAKAYKVPV
jgi:hypothetical protein